MAQAGSSFHPSAQIAALLECAEEFGLQQQAKDISSLFELLDVDGEDDIESAQKQI